MYSTCSGASSVYTRSHPGAPVTAADPTGRLLPLGGAHVVRDHTSRNAVVGGRKTCKASALQWPTAYMAAAAPTTGVVPAAADEVSALTAAQFAAHAQLYQAIGAQAYLRFMNYL